MGAISIEVDSPGLDLLDRARQRFVNQFTFKHSSRNFPLKLSTKQFSHRFPGLDEVQRDSAFEGPLRRALGSANSGPLSTTIVRGRASLGRESIEDARHALTGEIERATSIAMHSRLQVIDQVQAFDTAVRPRECLPVKSIDQRSCGASGTGFG